MTTIEFIQLQFIGAVLGVILGTAVWHIGTAVWARFRKSS
jgi:hypothetical protein